MKRIVIYKSMTGFTKQYAEWISKELKCECIELKEIKKYKIEEYDQVVYGGWIMGNMINGLDKIKKYNLKSLIIYAVGSSEKKDEIINEIIKQNNIENDFYYMQGGFHFKKIPFLLRSMLLLMKKSLKKKENKTEQEIYMENNLGTSYDCSKIEYIFDLVNKCKINENN